MRHITSFSFTPSVLFVADPVCEPLICICMTDDDAVQAPTATPAPAPARRRYPYAQLAKLVSTATQVQVKYLKRCANTVKRQHIATRRGPPNVCHAKPEKVPQLDHRVVSTSARWERLPKTTTTTIIIPQTAPTAQQAGSAISLAECCTRPIAQSALRGSSARER